jgi:Uma2 family endonuclease
MSIVKPTTRRWTRAEYYHLAELGWFRNQRVELIEGEIIQMPPQKNFHAVAIGLAEQALEGAFGPGHWVRTQLPLHLRPRSAPEPYVAVVPGSPRDYATRDHPTTALLIVEVSDTTLAYDRSRKASLHARTGISDYWIVNLIDRQLELRRNPVPDRTQRYRFGYADVLMLSAADHVIPLAAPAARIAVADLLP